MAELTDDQTSVIEGFEQDLSRIDKAQSHATQADAISSLAAAKTQTIEAYVKYLKTLSPEQIEDLANNGYGAEGNKHPVNTYVHEIYWENISKSSNARSAAVQADAQTLKYLTAVGEALEKKGIKNPAQLSEAYLRGDLINWLNHFTINGEPIPMPTRTAILDDWKRQMDGVTSASQVVNADAAAKWGKTILDALNGDGSEISKRPGAIVDRMESVDAFIPPSFKAKGTQTQPDHSTTPAASTDNIAPLQPKDGRRLSSHRAEILSTSSDPAVEAQRHKDGYQTKSVTIDGKTKKMDVFVPPAAVPQ